MQRDVYARPATHNPIVTSRWGEAVQVPNATPMMYGSRFRLKKNFNIDANLPPALKIILQAMKDYGMFHIDGGPRMVITSNDAYSPHTWDDPDVFLNPFDFFKADISWDDMELVSDYNNIGDMRDGNCKRE